MCRLLISSLRNLSLSFYTNDFVINDSAKVSLAWARLYGEIISLGPGIYFKTLDCILFLQPGREYHTQMIYIILYK